LKPLFNRFFRHSLGDCAADEHGRTNS
jgi:hypothetical protein